ncbi:hypothetical protein GCM10020256_58830 [Streptomyces thermocoprophilus]
MLSVRDRWTAAAVVGAVVVVATVRRLTRWWEYRGAHSAKPWEVIPTLCFGAGAGLVTGLLLYAVGVRLWRPAPREHAAVVSAGAGPGGPGGR